MIHLIILPMNASPGKVRKLRAVCEHGTIRDAMSAAGLDVGTIHVLNPAAVGNPVAAVIETIEATGGVVKNDKGLAAPVADPEWIDLGEATSWCCPTPDASSTRTRTRPPRSWPS